MKKARKEKEERNENKSTRHKIECPGEIKGCRGDKGMMLPFCFSVCVPSSVFFFFFFSAEGEIMKQ